MSFGDRLKELRGKRTQKEVARDLRLTRSTYSMYELSQREPDNDTLLKLAAYYHTSVSYLLGESDDATPEHIEDPRSEAGVDEVRRILLGGGMRPDEVDALIVLIKQRLPKGD